MVNELAVSSVHRLDLLRRRRADVLAVLSRYGASQPRVVGSTARGEDQLASDIDLLLALPEGLSLLDVIGLEQELSDLLDCSVEVLEEDALPADVALRMRHEAVAL